MKSYCVKERNKQIVLSLVYIKIAKNRRLLFFCKWASCGITKTKFVKNWEN